MRKPSFLGMEVFFIKQFKTLDEQLIIVHNRNLRITDYKRAKQFLLTNNYYNIINGYSKYFMDNETNIYKNNATFDEITHLHRFDTAIKHALMKSLGHAEDHIKYITAHRFAENYPNIKYAYLQLSSYTKNRNSKLDWLIPNLCNLIKKKSRQKKDNAIKHYVKNYNDVPIWVIVNFMDFGQINTLFYCLPTSLQNQIATNCLSFVHENGNAINGIFTPEIMVSFLDNMRQIRNVCAHNNKLIDFKCKSDIKYYNDLHDNYNISKNSFRNDVYNVFIILQCFVSRNEYAYLHNSFLKQIKNLDKKLNSISINVILKSLGFPEDWHENNK
ncbi:Abi family protein [Ruoffia sp. FAM 26254]|uniref:Abi family protein n=1 Tax=unclassified Ruoffia TaxID=2862149 RepID=UPI0038855D37